MNTTRHAMLALTMMLAGQAGAATLAPVSSDIEIVGSATIAAGPLKGVCKVTMYGHIDAMGRAIVEGALTRLEGADKVCSVVKAIGNWPVAVRDGSRVEMQSVDFAGPGNMHCKGNIGGTLRGGVIAFAGTLKGPMGIPCKLSGTLKTSPAIRIVH